VNTLLVAARLGLAGGVLAMLGAKALAPRLAAQQLAAASGGSYRRGWELLVVALGVDALTVAAVLTTRAPVVSAMVLCCLGLGTTLFAVQALRRVPSCACSVPRTKTTLRRVGLRNLAIFGGGALTCLLGGGQSIDSSPDPVILLMLAGGLLLATGSLRSMSDDARVDWAALSIPRTSD
jgi:hypothetical protein